MDYQQALDYLYQYVDVSSTTPRPPPELNLARTRALLAALGDPQDRFRSVVIAGTKGKGSTSAMIEAIGRAAGLRLGLWTSPHLHTYRERIQVDRELIAEHDLVRLVDRVRPAVEALAAGPLGAPSTFAIGFAIALTYFAEQSIDLAVLEVGLGGRYDSANVIIPLLSVITSISYDHMEILGDTLTQIAWDKAGILKPGVPGITGAQDLEALASIVRVAGEVGAPLTLVDDGRWQAGDRARLPDPPVVTILDPYDRYAGPHMTALAGTFQRENARLATGAALLLRDAGLPITDQAIGTGLAHVRWPARFEIIAGVPEIVIDGAHNGDSAARLVESLRERYPDRGVVLVFGASRGKDLPRMLAALAPVAAWVLTRSGHPRALDDLRTLQAQIRAESGFRAREVLTEPDPAAAIARAREIAGPNEVICVTGSLFVAAAAREALGLAVARDPVRV